jgi:hypothetical protein
MLTSTVRRLRTPLDMGSMDAEQASTFGGPIQSVFDEPSDAGQQPAPPAPAVRPIAPPSGPAPGATQPIDAPQQRAMLTDDGGSASIMQQLPDGAGGVVNVPPVSMAPPSVANDIHPSIPVAPATLPAPGGALTVAQQRAMNDAAGNYRSVTPESALAENAARGLYPGLILSPDGTRRLIPNIEQSGLSPELIAQARAHVTDVGYLKPPQFENSTAGSSPENLAAEAAIMRNSGGPAYSAPGAPAWAPFTSPAPAVAADTMPASTPTSGAVGGSASSAPGAPGTFGADDNLIASQVLPGANPRLLNMQGLSDDALQKILNSPDRLALAKQYLDSDVLGLNEQYQHDLTDATNFAGTHGQLGSGMVTNRYGDLFAGITGKKKAAELRYLADAAGGTIGDRLNAFDAASGAEGRVFTEGVSDRNESRTERGYQADLAQRALLNRILQNQAESTADQQAFDNAVRLFGLGNANNPEGAYETAAGQATSEAGGQTADVAALIRLLAQRNSGAAAVGA